MDSNYKIISIIIGTLALLAVYPMDYALAAKTPSSSPVDLQADKLVHDNNGQSVTAIGNVVLIQDGRTVSADKIIYNLQADTVTASGNVVFTEINGDKYYADTAEFNNALKDGFVEGLKTFLVDGSRFKASNARDIGGNKTVMKDAYYTPCEECKKHPDAAPLWQIRASEVEHDKEGKRVNYRNARFEVKGVPVAYFPYFSHPDGTVKRKSGFLTPSAGYRSEIGAFVQSSYYWDIAPEKDLTVGLMAMSNNAPLAMAQWRQGWKNASLNAKGTLTYSDKTDRNALQNIERNESVRGNIFVDGIWDINNKWRSGLKLDVASDHQFLRQYGFDNEDVLKNELYLERFSGRNYSVARMLAFQDLRIAENREDQPHILPEIQTSFLGEQGGVPIIGGRWSFDASLLGLVRENRGQDVDRIYSALGWKRRFISNIGLVSVLNANIQETAYYVNDRTGSNNSTVVKGHSTENRTFGFINALTSYPMTKQFRNYQMLIEPVASITISPNIGINNDIPNEDSQDVQIDTLNLFEPNRFPGFDKIEDKTHVTYGFRSGIYGSEGSNAEAFIGQSYRFDKNQDENPFSKGSGLDEQESDFVGQLSGNYKENYKLDYRFQLDNHSLSSQRHEVEADAKFGSLSLSSRYLFAKELKGTDINKTREQVNNSASYYINDNWRVSGSARHDLGGNSGLRQAGFGVDYLGQCISLSLIGKRNLTDEVSGDRGTEIMLRLGLKNLGEIETSSVTIGGNEK